MYDKQQQEKQNRTKIEFVSKTNSTTLPTNTTNRPVIQRVEGRKEGSTTTIPSSNPNGNEIKGPATKRSSSKWDQPTNTASSSSTGTSAIDLTTTGKPKLTEKATSSGVQASNAYLEFA